MMCFVRWPRQTIISHAQRRHLRFLFCQAIVLRKCQRNIVTKLHQKVSFSPLNVLFEVNIFDINIKATQKCGPHVIFETATKNTAASGAIALCEAKYSIPFTVIARFDTATVVFFVCFARILNEIRLFSPLIYFLAVRIRAHCICFTKTFRFFLSILIQYIRRSS